MVEIIGEVRSGWQFEVSKAKRDGLWWCDGGGCQFR